MAVLKRYTGTAWEAVGTPASGAAGAGLPLDVVPTTPHAKDDEFSDTSLDAKWTNPVTSAAGQTNTITVANGWMTLEAATAGTGDTGKRIFGIRQDAPTGSFTVSAKVGNERPTGTGADTVYGIFVERLTATAKAHVFGIQNGYSRFVEAIGVATPSHTADWSDWDSWESNVGPEAYNSRWLKIQWDSATSTLIFSFSGDGAGWHRLTTRTGMAQPEYIGLAMYNRNAVNLLADLKIHADWFRVTEP